MLFYVLLQSQIAILTILEEQNPSDTRNAKIGKLPLFSMFRFVKQMFSFWGYQ